MVEEVTGLILVYFVFVLVILLRGWVFTLSSRYSEAIYLLNLTKYKTLLSCNGETEREQCQMAVGDREANKPSETCHTGGERAEFLEIKQHVNEKRCQCAIQRKRAK